MGMFPVVIIELKLINGKNHNIFPSRKGICMAIYTTVEIATIIKDFISTFNMISLHDIHRLKLIYNSNPILLE